LDSNHPSLAAILARLRPETVADIKARIETAVTRQFGDNPDPDALARFLEDIRLAQSMSGIDMDYARHYTEMHQAGVDFMALAQAVKAADKDYR
jgi:hypothetical protein